MKQRLGVDLILGWLVFWPDYALGHQSGKPWKVRMTLVVRDQANVNSESLTVANQVINRIMSDAGFELSWIDGRDVLNADAPSTRNPAQQNTLPTEGYFALVITPVGGELLI
jgi:hypothetical protein